MFRIEGNLEDLRSPEIIISVLATAPQIHNQIVESQPELPNIMGKTQSVRDFGLPQDFTNLNDLCSSNLIC
jgi:hypothetical protein